MKPIETDIIPLLKLALAEEIAARSALPRKSNLTNGVRVKEDKETSIYRFEVPDNFLFEPSLIVRCTIGVKLTFSFQAIIADVHHQFVYFLVPIDLGEMIPEMMCDWNPSETTERLAKRCDTIKKHDLVSSLCDRDFSKNIYPVTKEPIFPSSFTSSQRDAVKESIGRKISVVIGERKRGKTGVAASLLFSSLREGKRVLYLSYTSAGLYDCMKEIVSLNPVIAEESVTVLDCGIQLYPQLSMLAYSMKGNIEDADTSNVKKLTQVISAEYEYDRVDELVQKLQEKKRQIQEATKEAEDIKAEMIRLQNASMIERMKQRINKADIDYVQSQYQNKASLVERLKQHAAAIVKEQLKHESYLPIPLKEKQTVEKISSQPVSLKPVFPSSLASARCIAATLHQALFIESEQLGEFDVVCIDDAHAMSLPEFFCCTSFAKEQCFILADMTEQPPQSISQLETARHWLQKNYFLYFQNNPEGEERFTFEMLPKEVASELANPDTGSTIFESALQHALNKTLIPTSVKGKVYCLDTENLYTISAQYLGKKKILPYNEVSARRVIECAKHALMNGNTTQSDILIVVPPSGQSMYLRELLKANQMTNIEIATFGSIRLCRKRSVIFDSTVAGIDFTLRLLDDKKSGRIRIADCFNTLLSTIDDDLYVVCDLSHFNTRYKDRLITRLFDVFNRYSENVANIISIARRFDDLTPEMQNQVLFSTAEEKLSSKYKTKFEQAKPSALDPTKTAVQQSIALSERKLKSEIRAALYRVLAKREIINIVAQYLEAYPLYRTTLETQKYYSILGEIDCENENDFKLVMDMWNLLIYETSNAQKTNHPLAAKAKVDSKIYSDIQQIYVYYHSDLEMVVEEGKHKLAQSIQKIFNDCIGKKPVTPTDWMNAYFVFLGRMEKYLDTVVNQIRT